ncbi:tetratricopeptide repeat protein [Amycolatopsis sp. FBCC-B4732]|uniref:AfsR/SARP family transcriptional regulator n=1 Tax=Amycolatopsis sp. FBCC-B4732 TaxID=3079339 RepID=UPI001FF49BAB|nr:BTAD domain-containing putative transcriptional regulator [Amycolatopsis sp. FBCC-B4732]UOX89992.1 tetratricopeptide repeat protein [Amycolatopsis sp. FBCC-B4732]
MRFGVLGPLEVTDGDRRLPLGGPKQQKVLAALLLAHGHVVPIETLVDVVWESEPPPSAEKQVRNAVSNLRGALGGNGHVIEYASRGYVLAAGTLDAIDFTSRLQLAREMRKTSRMADAVDEFRSALGMWRGAVLAGLECPALAPQITGLQEQRLAAYEECVALELELGRHRQLTDELTRWAEEHPLRERLAAQLMVAWHRSGTPAQALLAYKRIENALGEQLGIAPGPELKRLREQVTNTPSAPAAEQWTPRNDLPRDISYFTGRRPALERILSVSARTAGGTVVISAIDGMAGVGKTTLAVHVAHRLAGRFPDAQLFVDLNAHTPGRTPMSPSAALEKLLRALGLGTEVIPPELEDRSALWRAQLARRRVLVVLDNAADTAQIKPLLPGSTQSLALVTSRHRLTNLDANLVSLDVMPLADARELFVKVVGDDRPLADPGATEEVLRLCGCLPLAIRIAGARLRHRTAWTTSFMAARLRDDHRRLEELETGDLSVAAAFSLSYEQLPDDEKHAFRMAGVAPGADVEPHAVAALTGCAPEEAERKLENLVDAHLLQQTIPARYRFHDLIRAHAAKLSAAADSEAGRRAALTRLFDYYLSTASKAMDSVAPTDGAHRPTLPERAAATADVSDYDRALGWLNAERSNLVAMSEFSASHGWPAHASLLSSTVWRYFHISGNHDEALVVHTNALAAALSLGNVLFEADALASRGYIRWFLGQYQQALADCQAAVRIAADEGDRSLEGRALHALGLVHTRLGSNEEAADVLLRTLAAGRETGDHDLEGYALRGLGEIYFNRSEYADAITSYEEAVSVARRAGNETIEGYALRALGEIFSNINEHRKAFKHCVRALELARRTRNRNIENRALRTLGEIHRRLGEPEKSCQRYEEALHLAKETGNRYEEARAHEGVGDARIEYADARSATVHWQQALELYGQLGVPEIDRVRERLDAHHSPVR